MNDIFRIDIATLEIDRPAELDAVEVPLGHLWAGIWVRPNQPQSAVWFAELITGGRLVTSTSGLKFKMANRKEWDFVIGLCIVGQAKRLSI